MRTKTCTAPGCPNLIPLGHRFCERCKVTGQPRLTKGGAPGTGPRRITGDRGFGRGR